MVLAHGSHWMCLLSQTQTPFFVHGRKPIPASAGCALLALTVLVDVLLWLALVIQ